MCDVPTALAIINTSAALYGYVQQSAMADMQQDSIEEGYALQMKQLEDRYRQINENATDEVSERAREARAELARVRAVGAESGLGGVSQARSENETQMLRSNDIAIVESNRQNALRAAQHGGEAARIENTSRIRSINRPSLVGTGLQIAGVGAEYAKQTKDTPSAEAVQAWKDWDRTRKTKGL